MYQSKENIPLIVYLPLGVSQSGKDIFAKVLVDEFGFKRLHAIGDLKKFLEEHYGLPLGSCDSTEGKAYHPNPEAKNIQEIQLDFFHTLITNKTDPRFVVPYLKRELNRAKAEQMNLVVSGIRGVYGLKTILDFCKDDEVDPKIVFIKRDRAKPLESDRKVKLLQEIVINADYPITTIENNGTIEEFVEKAKAEIENRK